MGRQRSGKSKRASIRADRGLAPFRVPFFRHRRREKRPPKRALSSLGQGMLRLSNRPHGKETLSNTSCAALFESRRRVR
jgi:hypothetical protein